MNAPAIVSWGVEALVASTALMLLVLLLRGPARRSFGPDIAYALWALPVLRLVMPPVPAAWREAAVAPISVASETITIYVTEPLATTTTAVAAPAALPFAAIAAALWVAGSLVFLGWHALAHFRFCRRMLDQQVRGSRIDGGIHLIETEAASGPLAFGVMRKYVAFPRDFVDRYDQDERDLALAHELGHHARGDLVANWIALGVLALHWFNPVAWRAFRAFRADQEIANDARVLAGLSATARHAYACAIVKSAHGGAVSAACHLHTIDDLKGRLKMLTTAKTSRTRLLSGAAAVAVLTLAGLGLTASGTQAAASVRDRVETATGLTLAGLSAPTAAELPTPPQAADLPRPPAPPVAPAPVALPTPPAPPTPPVATPADGQPIKSVRVLTHHQDGTSETRTLPSLPALETMPEITFLKCPGKLTVQPLTTVADKDGTRRTIMCLSQTYANGATAAERTAYLKRNSTRMSMRMALSGLAMARRSLVNNAEMDTGSRSDALKGIDDAIAEVTKQMKDTD